MIVLDTHAWVWWLDAPHKLSPRAARAIERSDRVAISVLTVFEVAALVERRRMEIDQPTRQWVRTAVTQERLEVLPLTLKVAVDASQLRFGGDPFDRIVYATARAEDAQLVTRDERIREFDPKRAVW